MRQLRIRTVLIATGAAIAIVAGSTTAYAAIAGPMDGNGVIHGCYYKPDQSGSSQLVLQDTTTNCPKNTTAITWNQTGPQGCPCSASEAPTSAACPTNSERRFAG